MESWQKGAPAVKKMTKAAQGAYFKKFPDRQEWFKKNHPDMAHFDVSAKQGSIQKVDKAKEAARKALSLKAHGATRGTATGGEGGNAEVSPRDTIAPLSRDQHSAVQSAKRTSEAPAKAAEKPKTTSAPKPIDRLALIKKLHQKSQSAAGKQKRAAKFDVPTEDPDDATHDDYVDQHYGLHQYNEDTELVDQINEISHKKIVSYLNRGGKTNTGLRRAFGKLSTSKSNYMDKYAKVKAKTPKTNEEVQIDEISDKTAYSYLDKVTHDVNKNEADPTKRSASKRNKAINWYGKVHDRVSNAIKTGKLKKEEVQVNEMDNKEVKQVDEGIVDDMLDNYIEDKIAKHHANKHNQEINAAYADSVEVTKKIKPLDKKIAQIKKRVSYQDKTHKNYAKTRADLDDASAARQPLSAERLKHYDKIRDVQNKRDSNTKSDVDTYHKYGLVGLGVKKLKQRLTKEAITHRADEVSENVDKGEEGKWISHLISKKLNQKKVELKKKQFSGGMSGYTDYTSHATRKRAIGESTKASNEAVDNIARTPAEWDAMPKPKTKKVGGRTSLKNVNMSNDDLLDRIRKNSLKWKYTKEEVEHTDASKELVLHADNNRHLHRSSYTPIMANLQKKVDKGTYDHSKAKALWKYHADRAAHSYAKEHGDGTPWHKMFSVADRNRAANHFADVAKDHLGLNESYTGMQKEEVEQIDELSKDKLAWYLKKSVKNMDKKGDNMVKRDKKFSPGMNPLSRKIGGIVSRQNSIATASKKYLAKEDVEQIDELKSTTLASYIKKASHDVAHKGAATMKFSSDARAAFKDQDFRTERQKRAMSDATFEKSWKRRKFIAKAADKLVARTNEEVEQIDELKKSTLINYIKKASDEKTSAISTGAREIDKGIHGDPSVIGRAMRKVGKRTLGVNAALKNLAKEETSYIEERLSKYDAPSEWISDFVASDNPKFAGKSKKERMNMALGAYYSAKRGK